METIWIVPEYCPGPIFLGWHLYERHPTLAREGFTLKDWIEQGRGGASWIRDWIWLRPVQALIRAVRPDVPDVGFERRTEYKFIEWFVEAFPVGFLLDVDAVEPRGYTRLESAGARNLREPPPDMGTTLAYLNARMFVRAAQRHGQAFVDGAPGHPREKWTSHDWMCVLQDLENAMWLRDLARAVRSGGPRPAPLPPRYGWMELVGPAPAVELTAPSAPPRKRAQRRGRR